MTFLQNVFVAVKDSKLRYPFDRPIWPGEAGGLPRNIYAYWDTGLDNAPEICRHCIDSWRRLNPGWSIEVLDATAAAAIVDPTDYPEDLGKAHYADILRMRLMAERGGVWVDATVLCLRPLDDWLPVLLGQCDFLALARPNVDRMVANWFFAATEDADLARRLHRATERFWAGRSKGRVAYFWQHYLIELEYLTSRSARRAMNRMPKISVQPLIALEKAIASGTLGDDTIALISKTPVQKLNYKTGITVDTLRAVETRIAAVRQGSAPP